MYLFPFFVCDSGDTDSVIPITSTRYYIDALKLPTISPWRPWYEDGEVSNVQRTGYHKPNIEMVNSLFYDYNNSSSFKQKLGKWIKIRIRKTVLWQSFSLQLKKKFLIVSKLDCIH